MRASVRQVGRVCIIDLAGHVTIGETNDLIQRNVRRLVGDGHERILLNLTRVSYIDSTGIGEIAACCKIAHRKNATVKLLAGPIYDQLCAATFGAVFEMFRDEDSALQSFAADEARV